MRSNADITIYNKYRASNTDMWQRTQISAVEWEQRHARSQFDSDDLATVYIPIALDLNYVKPRVWQALAAKTGSWTLQVGDVIVKGLVSVEMVAGVYTLTNLKNVYDDVLVITSVDTYDYGSASLQHFRIGAK